MIRDPLSGVANQTETAIPKSSPKKMGFYTISATGKAPMQWVDCKDGSVDNIYYRRLLANWILPSSKSFNPRIGNKGKIEQEEQKYFFTAIPKVHREELLREKVTVVEKGKKGEEPTTKEVRHYKKCLVFLLKLSKNNHF